MANVYVTFSQMQDAARRLDDGRAEIDDLLGRLSALVDQLVSDGYVTDSSSVQFRTAYEEFTSGARATIGGLTGMAEYLTRAAQAFADADAALAGSLGR